MSLRSCIEDISRIRCDNLGLSLHFVPSLYFNSDLQSAFYTDRNAEHPYLLGDALLILLKFTKLSVGKQKLLPCLK